MADIHAQVQKALREGRLKRPSACEKCGRKGPVVGHHYKGYAPKYWLTVQWLCASCHQRTHRKITFTTTVRIVLPKAMLAKVDQICRAEERSRSWILRTLVYDGLHLRDDKEAEQ